MKYESISDHFQYLIDLSTRGGPKMQEFGQLSEWFRATMRLVKNGRVTREQIRELWDLCGDAFSTQTIQGILVRKPHGYAGDFEIIDKIHTEWVSPLPHLKLWDIYLHSTTAPQAVRNRKKYLHKILLGLEASFTGEQKVLNIGSGPARDLQEYFALVPLTRIFFDCVDIDPKAIAYARNLINGFDHRVNWYCHNMFRFTTSKRYDLIWSAGVFDYLNDKQFMFLLKRLYKMTKNNGHVVVGNFSPNNPTRANMEFGEWIVKYRNEEQLMKLAIDSGVRQESVTVTSEPLGVNLFLSINK